MYSIKKVSEMLNIPAVTIRAWETRYQLVRPVRSSGGHRLYTDKDLDTLRWIKQQMEDHNIKISEAVSLLRQGASLRPNERYSEDGHSVLSHNAHDELIETLYLNLISLNAVQAHHSIDLAFSMYHHHFVFHHILTPIMHRIGTEWENGRLSVTQEHFSSELIMQRCAQFLRILPTLSHFPRVLSACPEGEHHHMGLMLFSLFLRNKGMDIIYMGPNTPLHELPQWIRMKDISVVVVSITDVGITSKIQEWVELCLQQFPNVKLVLGGRGFYQCEAPISRYVLSGGHTAWEEWYHSTIVAP